MVAQTPRYDTDMTQPIPIVYDTHFVGTSDLHHLNAEQAKALLDELVDPTLTEMRAWAAHLTAVKAELEAELSVFKGRRPTPEQRNRGEEIRQSLRQLDEGLMRFHVEDGLAAKDFEKLKPLSRSFGHKPGLTATQLIVAKLEKDRAYLAAYIERWPEPETRQPYVVSRKRQAPVYLADNTEVVPGQVVELLEGQARGARNIYDPVEIDPVISKYGAA